MKRIVPGAALVLLTTIMTAQAQDSGMIGGTGSGFGSFASDILNNAQGMAATGVPAHITAGSASRLMPSDDPLSARDGCINFPGQAHNSADCSRILSWDPQWKLPDKPVSEMTGAEENMLRNYRILTGKNIP
jgi:hypothetical protein